MDPEELETTFSRFIGDLKGHLPDGIVEVDLNLLKELELLECDVIEEEYTSLSHSFYVIESADKLTLFNQHFVVWIVPRMQQEIPSTYTLVALNSGAKPQLEMAFTTSGVYNHSSLVLKILEKFLEQIEENEQELGKFS